MMIGLITKRATRAVTRPGHVAAASSGLIKRNVQNSICCYLTSTFADARRVSIHQRIPLLLPTTTTRGILSVMMVDHGVLNGGGGDAHQLRAFSAASSNKHKKSTAAATKEGKEVNGSSYLEEKRAAKERRGELYEGRQARLERLKTRRSSSSSEHGHHPRDELRRAFRSFFIKRKVDEEFMNRKARQAGLEWKINVAVVLERLNVVQPDKEPWEVEYENLRAYLDTFGKMYPKELCKVDEERMDDIALTDEEVLALLPKGFTPAPRETEADKTGNVRTVQRKLKSKVFLAVYDRFATNNKNNNSKDYCWQLPTVELQGPDETLLDAAKRALASKVGPQVEYWCPSNCPCSVDLVAFPSEYREQQSGGSSGGGYYGTKTFFMRLQHDEGDVVDASMNVKDFAWLESDEMVQRVRDEQGDYMGKFYHYML